MERIVEAFPFGIAEISYYMHMFSRCSMGSYSQQESFISDFDELKIHFPNSLMGKEKTPALRQQISLSSPTFFGWKITSTFAEEFALIFSFLGLKV